MERQKEVKEEKDKKDRRKFVTVKNRLMSRNTW